MSKELWTVQEVAKNYRLKDSWVYQHMGELPHYKLGNLVRFDPDELDDFLRKHRSRPKEIKLGKGDGAS